MSPRNSRYHRVTLVHNDEVIQSFFLSEQETLLEGAENLDLELPFGCRTGACATCVGKLISGNVRYDRHPNGLNESQRERQYVLLCVAKPVDDCVIEVGAGIQGEMMGNPFRTNSQVRNKQSL